MSATPEVQTLIEESTAREIAYLRATINLRDRELADKAAAIGALTGLAQVYRDELIRRGEHTTADIVATVIAEAALR